MHRPPVLRFVAAFSLRRVSSLYGILLDARTECLTGTSGESIVIVGGRTTRSIICYHRGQIFIDISLTIMTSVAHLRWAAWKARRITVVTFDRSVATAQKYSDVS